jgi:3-deoxy-D-manno-octulosonate 8-phosphate phosphatase KdsC-like HAD superfamily phosphatase
MNFRTGSFILKNKNIKLIVIGDGVFLPQNRLFIPRKNKEGTGYIEDDTYIYLSAKTELNSEGKEAVPFNAYDGFPINETWKKGLKVPVALVCSGDYDEGQTKLIYSRAANLNFTFYDVDIGKQEEKKFAVYLGVKNKLIKLEAICKELNIRLSETLYIDNELNPIKDRDLLEKVGIIVCLKNNIKYDNIVKLDRIIKLDAESGDALIRIFSDTYIENTLESAKNFHEETREGLSNICESIIGDKSNTKKIKLMIFDIDGTCTNNMKIYSVDGNEFKRFALKDIDAIRKCLQKGYEIAFVTGDKTNIPKHLVENIIKNADAVCYEINVESYGEENAISFKKAFYQEFKKLNRNTEKKEIFLIKGSAQKKVNIVCAICEHLGFALNEIAYMGDEDNEIGVTELIASNGGLAACPANATNRIKTTKDIIVTKSKGGEGNIQEFIDYILERNIGIK